MTFRRRLCPRACSWILLLLIGGTGAAEALAGDTTGFFRPSTGTLYLKYANATGSADLAIAYGMPGDFPVTGDWDGDGRDTIGVYRGGVFLLRNSNTSGYAEIFVSFGVADDFPIVGDWDGDGTDTVGIYRGGAFFLRNSNTSGYSDLVIPYGAAGDIPLAGDWDGDRSVTIGVYRPSDGSFYLRNSLSAGQADLLIRWGSAGDHPVVGDWDGNRTTTLGLRGSQGNFRLRNSNSPGPPDLAFILGAPGDVPLSGSWNGTAVTPAPRSSFYVSPNGSSFGDGSVGNPWDLRTALKHPPSVGPGATIWMRGGTYRGCFTSFLGGSPGAPVTLRQYPGERATIDSYGGSCSVTFNVVGSWSVMQGFEVMYSGPSRTSARPIGVNVLGTHTRLVNLIVHDNGEGIGLWDGAIDSEVYGCIIYNNGTYDNSRGWGSGIYSQSTNGTKHITDNIAFNQFGNGTQIQGSDRINVKGYQIEGNAIFNNGSPLNALKINLLVGSGQPAERISLINNYLYLPNATATNAYLGYSDALNKDLVVRDNHFAGGGPNLQLGGWEEVTLTGNKFHGTSYLINMARPSLFGWSRSVWDYNQYYFTGPTWATILSILYQGFGLFNWQQLTGYDRNSSFVSALSGFDVLIRPNQYEPGRAHIIILNYDLRNSAAVDPSGVLRVGQEYEIRDAQNYFGAPVVTGVYDGNPISINLAALTSVAAPVGLGAPGSEAVRLPAHTPRDFNALVLIGR